MPNETLIDLTRRQAREQPDVAALWFEGRVTRYDALDRLASQCANALIASGVRPGDRVAVLAKGCDDFFILWLGALKARACLAPASTIPCNFPPHLPGYLIHTLVR